MALLLLAVIYLSFISLGLPDSLLGSAWPAMYESLRVPLNAAGYVSMIIAGGTVVSSIFSERLIRRFGTGAVMAVSVLMTAAALLGFSFARSFAVVCLCAVPLGLGAGSVDAALNNYVALHYKARHMSWLHCFWGVGASLGPLIMGGALTRGDSWNAGYRIISILQFCLVAILLLSLPLWKKDTEAGDQSGREASPWKTIRAIPGVKQALAACFCYCSVETITGLWGSSYLVLVKNIAPETAAQWISLYYIGITVGRFISGFISIKLNNRQMARLGQAVAALGVLVLIAPLGRAALLPGFFLIGLGCAPIYPSLLHETPENFGAKYSQAVMGIQMASAYIGTTTMPLLFGAIGSFAGFAVFPVCVGVILAALVVMTEALNRKVARKT